MTAINLMSLQAQRHACVWTRIWQWTRVLYGIAVVLGLITLDRYVAYLSAAQDQVALEADYEPIEELKRANKLLANQIAAIRTEEQFVLALSDQEPTITLLGIVSDTVAETDERVFLKKIELNNLGLAGGPSTNKNIILDLTGVANNGAAVNEFAAALQNLVPFGKVDIASSQEHRIKTQIIQDFVLQGNF